MLRPNQAETIWQFLEATAWLSIFVSGWVLVGLLAT